MSSVLVIKPEQKIIFTLIIFYIVGIFGLSFPPTSELFRSLTPFTLIMNIALLFLFHKPWTKKHIAIFAVIAIFGYLIEVLGVATGLVFGQYNYHETLGFKLFGTPLIIGLNWLMLTYFAFTLTQFLNVSRPVMVFTGAGLMVLYDYILEPVAINLDMWSWGETGAIPILNYFAWFVISAIFLTLMHIFNLKQKNRLSNGLFAIQAGFFICLNVIFRLI